MNVRPSSFAESTDPRVAAVTPPRRPPGFARQAPRAVRGAALGLYASALVFVMLWPREYVDAYVSEELQGQYVPIHIVAFAGLAACALWALARPSSPWRWRWRVWWAASLFGLLLEWLQGALPGIGRSCSVTDMRNNAIGAALGVLLTPRRLWPDDPARGRVPEGRGCST